MPDTVIRQDERKRMVEEQLAARGIGDSRVLDAMRDVPREDFVAPEMVEFAYYDAPLPIDEGQTISQPYIVALMIQALELDPADRVLEVGTGSGYAAAVLSRIADQVFTMDRHESLVESARRRFHELGYENVRARTGDGTLGWEEHAPYDAIVVAAGGPDVPPALRQQLAPDGRLVIPTGDAPRVQELLRLRRVGDDQFREEKLGDVRFVPLIGVAGWEDPDATPPKEAPEAPTPASSEISVPELIRSGAEPIPSIEGVDLRGFLDRVGDARLVLLGEATHGSSEFYRMRSRLTRALLEEKDFDFVAVEADWPDAAQVDRFVRGEPRDPEAEEMPFTRFPSWMWANEEVRDFVHWLRGVNAGESPDEAIGFHGLDLYGLNASIRAVLEYLDEVDPDAAETARNRYACLSPWEGDPASYGRAAVTGQFEGCEEPVTEILTELLEQRLEYEATRDSRHYMDAMQNARLVANAERYYRVMYYGTAASWNLRDQHMFDTLESLLGFYGEGSKGVVWAHNSHVGDASATEMKARGQHNLGQLVRERRGNEARLVGFGTHGGRVAAARDWDGPVEEMKIEPSHPRSYERLCHRAELDAFLLPLDGEGREQLRSRLLESRLQRAIGVVYRPGTELQSHYLHASLPRQFDEYVWFDETSPVTPLGLEKEEGVPETFPFAV